LLTVGQNIDETVWWFISMERSCQSQLLAEAAGKPILIRPDQAYKTLQQVGTPLAGWFSYQPIYQVITREQPDVFD
jgi:ribulose-5-phosphate 4-epimerase/fuculose-1-phosphate aldolase